MSHDLIERCSGFKGLEACAWHYCLSCVMQNMGVIIIWNIYLRVVYRMETDAQANSTCSCWPKCFIYASPMPKFSTYHSKSFLAMYLSKWFLFVLIVLTSTTSSGSSFHMCEKVDPQIPIKFCLSHIKPTSSGCWFLYPDKNMLCSCKLLVSKIPPV